MWSKRLASLRKFDIFNKTDRSILVKSKTGGLVTLVGLIAMFILAIYEVASFRSVELIESVTVDTSRDQTISLRFDITFHEMACKDITIDLVDQNSILQPTNISDISKVKVYPKIEIIPEDSNCEPCFEGADEPCCTCEQVKVYFQENSIIENPLDRPQCRGELAFSGNSQRVTEGCRVSGKMTALKGSGNFHVAPGTATTSINGAHSHTMNPFSLLEDLQNTRLSHTMHLLTFGEADHTGTLNGVSFRTSDIVRHVYYIRLVPTVYIDGTNIVRSYQYSVTNHTEVIDLANTFSLQLPGVFWKYDFSPMLVLLERKEKYFTHLLTRLCAVVGGTWVVIGLIFSFIQQGIEKLCRQKKK